MNWKGIEYARVLRKHQTHEEKIMWRILRNKRFLNLKWRRQWPIRFGSLNEYFIVDFYFAKLKLALEIDGKIHLKRKKYDKSRDKILRDLGIKVIHLDNEEVNDIDKLRNKLVRILLYPKDNSE
jgi:very-short-patch-repair endonuclease